MDSSVSLLRFLFLVAPDTRRCSEKTGDQYHPNNQRPRRVIPKGVNEHDECNHATAKQKFPMAAGNILIFSHSGNLKPRRLCCERIFPGAKSTPKETEKLYVRQNRRPLASSIAQMSALHRVLNQQRDRERG